MKCPVCKEALVPKKRTTYTATDKATNYAPYATYFDVMDCPECGCQKVLGKRYMKADDCDTTDVADDTESDMEQGKTCLEDCQKCWCNTCANIEKCSDQPQGWLNHVSSDVYVVVPYPCSECTDGRQYLPITPGEECTCEGYVEGGRNNG